jgi:hypothetical protein
MASIFIATDGHEGGVPRVATKRAEPPDTPWHATLLYILT